MFKRGKKKRFVPVLLTCCLTVILQLSPYHRDLKKTPDFPNRRKTRFKQAVVNGSPSWDTLITAGQRRRQVKPISVLTSFHKQIQCDAIAPCLRKRSKEHISLSLEIPRSSSHRRQRTKAGRRSSPSPAPWGYL